MSSEGDPLRLAPQGNPLGLALTHCSGINEMSSEDNPLRLSLTDFSGITEMCSEDNPLKLAQTYSKIK